MSTTNEQKTETTCNPCDSVVTIHVNKDAICGDGGKPRVDNKTISYNNKGELQLGYREKVILEYENDDSEVIKKSIKDMSMSEIITEDSVEYIGLEGTRSFVKNSLYSSGYETNVFYKDENEGHEMKESFDVMGYTKRFNKFVDGKGYSETDYYLDISTNHYGEYIVTNEVYGGDVLNSKFSKVVQNAHQPKDKFIDLNLVVNEKKLFDFSVNKEEETVVNAVNLKLNNAVDIRDKEVEFTGTIIMVSPNGTKFKVEIGDDGSFLATKVN